MRADLNQIKSKVLPILKEKGVIRAALFGSYVRGEERDDSDIDLLVEVPNGTGLFAFGGLKRKLEEALDKKVDLVTYNSLHPMLRDQILNEQVSIL